MTDQEHHEYLCSILSKLVPCSEVTAVELMDLASALWMYRIISIT